MALRQWPKDWRCWSESFTVLCDGKVWLVPGYHVVSVLCIVSPGVSLYSEVCRILQRPPPGRTEWSLTRCCRRLLQTCRPVLCVQHLLFLGDLAFLPVSPIHYQHCWGYLETWKLEELCLRNLGLAANLLLVISPPYQSGVYWQNNFLKVFFKVLFFILPLIIDEWNKAILQCTKLIWLPCFNYTSLDSERGKRGSISYLLF